MPRFYDMHGTTLHLFVMLFPVQYMEKRFALETRNACEHELCEVVVVALEGQPILQPLPHSTLSSLAKCT